MRGWCGWWEGEGGVAGATGQFEDQKKPSHKEYGALQPHEDTD